ncbi:unnamed protein product [Meloidogyne enterolobii]|uniref:Uncharacterized protein n=1 Tax=Meloidogyne enterolobii TaxID=390850 RepID=A0ACB0Z6T3_MELEN
MNELDSFFAKKAKKAKKKGVIRLQEVAEQLELRARIQDELDENETKNETEPTTTKISSNNNDNEDSEWLDFDDKPILPSVIKEMADVDIELEESEMRSSVEPVKTWNLNNSENIDVVPLPVTPKKEKYEPKAAARAQNKQNPLDLKNEMLFPSLSDAPKIEQILKKEDEENRLREIEEKKEKQLKEEKLLKQQQRYVPRFQAKDAIPKNVPPASDEPDNWRAAPEPASKGGTNIAKQQNVKKSITTTNDSDNWRDRSETTTTEVKTSRISVQSPKKDDTDNWRSNTSATAATEIKPKNISEQPVKKTYVPPSMRANKQ